MIQQHAVLSDDVVIYKADQRGIIEKGYKQFCTFNYGAYSNEYRQPFHQLKFVNDVFLPAQQTMQLDEYQEYNLLVLPVIGGVDVQQDGETTFIGAEQYFWKLQHTTLSVTNPFEANEVNFLLIAFDNTNTEAESTGIIDLTQKNRLETFIRFSEQKISLGIYEGRQEDVYPKTMNKAGVFCMCIRGVFEVNGRLLHPRDCVHFHNDAAIEFEALSEDSIILLIETR